MGVSLLLVAPIAPSAASSSIACEVLDAKVDHALELRHAEELDSAEKLYREVLRDSSPRGCFLQVARSANGLGSVLVLQWRLMEAVQYFGSAAEAIGQLEEMETVGESDRIKGLQQAIALNLSGTHFRLGWYEEALVELRELAEHGSVDSMSQSNKEAYFLYSARAYRALGQLEEAAHMIKKALALGEDLRPRTRASLLGEQAWVDIETGQFSPAETRLKRALAVLGDDGPQLGKANLVTDLAELELRRENWQASLDYSNKALRMLQGARSQDARAQDLNAASQLFHLKSRALWHLGETADAIRVAEQGIELLEQARGFWGSLSMRFFSVRQRMYRHRQMLAIKAEGGEAVFRIIESYKAQGLLSSVAADKERQSLRMDGQERRLLQELQAQLLAAVVELDLQHSPEGQREFQKKRAALLDLRARRRARRVSAEGADLAPDESDTGALPELFPSGTLAIALLGGPTEISALTFATGTGLKVHQLSLDRLRVERAVEAWVRQLETGKKPSQQQKRQAQRLSLALLAPLREELAAAQRIAIIAEGNLQRLPFEALPHPVTDRPLIESHEIVYLPSFSVLERLRSRAHGCKAQEIDLLAVGDPIFSSRDSRWPGGADPRSQDEAAIFDPLPGTRLEVSDIVRGWQGGLEVALGGEANKRRFLASAAQSKIIHVATHARSDPRFPERSKIALSCVDANGAILESCDLYFNEITNLNLCGQLVVLSACATAAGPILEGEGVLGLPWAFLHAGAHSVVASLWKVDDVATAELMLSFHCHLRAGARPAAALRRAKREQLDQGSPVSTWAAFVTIGDW
jgi:CHAT domain-containing protein